MSYLPPSFKQHFAASPLRGHRSSRRGVATIELALILPFVVFCGLVTVDFGRVMHANLVVSNAARCGAEFGAMHKVTNHTRPFWESEVREAIDEEMQGLPQFASEDLETACSTTIDDDDLTRVKIDVRYRFHTLVDWSGIPATVELHRSVTMRQVR